MTVTVADKVADRVESEISAVTDEKGKTEFQPQAWAREGHVD
jgi:hypothetical protein